MKKALVGASVTLCLLSVAIVIAASSASGQDNKVEAIKFAYGIHPFIHGGDFTMELDCKHPHDPKAACKPNCCLLVDKQCIKAIYIAGRCHDLPHRPIIYKIVFTSNCRIQEVAAAEMKTREANTGYMFEPSSPAEVKIGSGQ